MIISVQFVYTNIFVIFWQDQSAATSKILTSMLNRRHDQSA